MKRLIGIFSFLLALICLVSCGKDADNEKTMLDTPVVTVKGQNVSWEKVANAKGYIVSVNSEAQAVQTETTFKINATQSGDYLVKVKAVADSNSNYKDSKFSEGILTTINVVDKDDLATTTIWVVGDSTVCDYSKVDSQGNPTVTDATYFYDRFGYATQFANYMNDKVIVKNLALSGRSSKSFLEETNYTTLTNGIKAGDFLVIGFGHNDEKSDDSARFASANESTETKGSFKYNLYNYYCKIALDVSATPIICSPIVRASKTNDYTGSNAHITDNGDYAKACRDLGTEKNIQVVDLTTLTKVLYTNLGYDNARYLHAMTSGIDNNTPNLNSVDATHINIFGAKMVAYLFATTIKNSDCALNYYIKDNLIEPTQANDLIKNKFYKFVEYKPLDFEEYNNKIAAGKTDAESGEVDTLAYSHFKTLSNDWIGTAFGDAGGDPYVAGNGYVGKEVETGVFEVGQGNSTGSSLYKGKIASTAEARGYVLRKVDAKKNFTLEADAEVLVYQNDGKQGGFGLIIRDDCHAPIKDASVGTANSYSAGMLVKSTTSTGICFSRDSRDNGIVSSNTINEAFNVGATCHLKIERVGQIVNCYVNYNNVLYKATYTDVDLTAIDNDYIYVGMFGARGIIAKYTNVVFTITGDSQGA